MDPVESVKTTSIGVFFSMGSKFEEYSQNGISHFIEHMLFRTNKFYESSQAVEIVESIGGKINAFTTKEYVCVYSKVLSENTGKLIQVLFNLIMYPSFEDRDIESEKKIITNEIHYYEDRYNERCQNNLIEASWKGHPLSQRILGTVESIGDFNNKTLAEYYNSNLCGDRIVISISGLIEKNLLNSLEKYFSRICSKAKYEQKEIEKISFKPKYIKESKSLKQHYLSIGYQCFSYSSKKIVPFLILHTIFGSGFSSILYKALRKDKELIYSVGTLPLIYKEGGIFLINTSSPSLHSIHMLIGEIKKVIEELKKNGINLNELLKAKSMIKSQYAFSLESIDSRMMELGKIEVLDISKNNDFYKTPNQIDDIFQLIEKITVDNINEVLFELFSKEPSVSIIEGIT
ncbi:M16 family metallopeptidase [Heyndrickxia oleronia]|uniref:M16 family metallopeptidase n=2 Tax=Heyndrickxia TaxID=2837504 RepID=UPI0015D1A71B|nr:pitrilysin family protein [Heyndrickxia oleronia]NYV68675.1 insulinase family protein [Bacillus sp. Gen3]